MKVKSESKVAQLCPTLSDSMDCSLPGSSVHGSLQARVLEWGAIVEAIRLGQIICPESKMEAIDHLLKISFNGLANANT